MSSYDQPEEFVSMEQFHETMRLVRLQIALPVSVLIALGTSIICTVGLKPNIGNVSSAHPTLLTPDNLLVGLYWVGLFIMQLGLCLLVVSTRSDQTKDTLVHGVGMRFAIANCLHATWVVCFTLEWFLAAEIIVLVNTLNVLTVFITLLPFPPSTSHPLDFILIHAPVTALFALLLELTSLHGGMVALHLFSNDARSLWPALGGLLGVHVTTAFWECCTLNLPLAVASEYLLVALLVSKPTGAKIPEIPTRPPPLLAAIIACLVLHPLALVGGLIWGRAKREQGRIRLEEEVEAADERAREAEVEAERARVRLERHE